MLRLYKETTEPMQQYMCLWVAFNNIYAVIAKKRGRLARIKFDNGTIVMRSIADVSMPDVIPTGERKLLELVFTEFDATLKENLVSHASTGFFAGRTPQLHGTPVEYSPNKHKLNGVLNVGFTSDIGEPIWSPIDAGRFKKYVNGQATADDTSELARQILFLLYTIRNNTFHGSKEWDDANDQEVLEKAIPLLLLIVEAFTTKQVNGY